MFLGFVGEGLITAAVHGPIFASPSSKTVLAAIRTVGKDHPGIMQPIHYWRVSNQYDKYNKPYAL